MKKKKNQEINFNFLSIYIYILKKFSILLIFLITSYFFEKINERYLFLLINCLIQLRPFTYNTVGSI